MQSPNLSKLIVWFIAIALVSSSALFAFSSYISSPRGVESAATIAIPPPDKAFLSDSVPAGTTDAEIAALQANEADNATIGLAKVLAQEIVSKNPNGPAETNGQSAIVTPENLSSLVDNYIQTHPFSASSIRSKITLQNVSTVDSADPAVLDSYFAKLNDALFSLPVLDAAGVGSVTLTDELAANIQSMQKISAELQGLQVPKPLAGFHKSVLSLLDTTTNYAQLISNDPVGAVALDGEYRNEVSATFAEMNREIQGLQQVGVLPAGRSSIVGEIFGIKTAYAFTFVDLLAYAQRIWIYLQQHWEKLQEQYRAVILDFLKNTLLRQMTKQVVNWVAGGPEPQFITNWDTFFTNAAIGAAGQVLAQAAPQLCGAGGGGGGPGSIDGLGDFAGFIKKVMTPIDTAGIPTRGFNAYPSCSLTDTIISINDFQQDFRNGGWPAYATILQPQNTLAGSLVLLSDKQLIASAEAEARATAKSVSGGGFTGQMACDDGNPPTTQDEKHSDGEGGFYTIPKGSCKDGSRPHVTTPGVFSKDLSTQGFNAAYQRLVTAGDYKALVAYIADVALNRLFQEGAKGLLSYGRKQGSGSYTPPGGTDTPPTSTAPPPETPSSDPKTLAQQILARKQSSLDDARSIVSSLQDTITILQQIVSACSSNQAVVDGAKAEIIALAQLRNDTLPKIETLKTQVAGLNGFIQNPTTIADLVALYGNLTDAQTEADNMSIQRQKADGVYQQAGSLYASCSNDALTSTPPQPPPGSSSTSTTP